MKLPSLAEMFRRADDVWICDVCMLSNKLTDQHCVACSALQPHSQVHGGNVTVANNNNIIKCI